MGRISWMKVNVCAPSTLGHGRIIKWTLRIGFLTLAGMDPVVEGNRGIDSKRRVARIPC